MTTATAQSPIKTGDTRIRVVHDSDPESPRECDNLGTITTWHRRYNLGEEHKFDRPIHLFTSFFDKLPRKTKRKLLNTLVRSDRHIWNDYKTRLLADEMGEDNWEDFVDWQLEHGGTDAQMAAVHEAASEVVLILPLYMYDHSGIALSTGPFGCPWDSGQVGFVWATHEDIKKSWPTDEEWLAKGQKCMEIELATYGQFVEGDVWGFIHEKATVCDQDHVHWEETDSCWGFYGTGFDNGMADNFAEEDHEKLKEALGNPEHG